MKVSTSILSSNDRIHCVEMLNHTHTSYIHVDVMDGMFVPDKQFYYIGEIKAINTISKYPIDVHLMVEEPIEYINQFHDMNIEYVTIHVEIGKGIKKIIRLIHDMGYKVGLAIKPNTDIKMLEKYLDDIDLILVMSVEPGKGGQEFIHSSVDKIKSIKKLIGDRNILIEVDGGINDKTISLVQNVDIVVSGSYIVKAHNYYQRIESLLRKKYVHDIKKKPYRNIVSPVKKMFLFILIYWVIVLTFYLLNVRTIDFCQIFNFKVCNQFGDVGGFLIPGLIFFALLLPIWLGIFVALYYYYNKKGN